MRFVIPYLFGLICLLCCSCSLKPSHVLFEQKSQDKAVTDTQPAVRYSYLIKNDDILQIRNIADYRYLANEASGAGATTAAGQSYQVDEDGNVTLPAIGHVPVAGLTRTQAQNKIEELYKQKLLNKESTIIELKVLNLKVNLFGEISAQGNQPLLKEKTTLIDIIGQAGGLTKNADEKTVKIIRGPKQETIWVDLSDIRTIADPRLIMHDGDVVYISQNKRAVRDEKLQNFSTIMQPSLLIFNTALILLTLFR